MKNELPTEKSLGALEKLTVVQVDDTDRPSYGKFEIVSEEGTPSSYLVAELWYKHGSREDYLRSQKQARLLATAPALLGSLKMAAADADFEAKRHFNPNAEAYEGRFELYKIVIAAAEGK